MVVPIFWKWVPVIMSLVLAEQTARLGTRHADHASQDQRWGEKFTGAIICALFRGTPENSTELLLRSSKVILGGAAMAL